jgi:hypothetical protein
MFTEESGRNKWTGRRWRTTILRVELLEDRSVPDASWLDLAGLVAGSDGFADSLEDELLRRRLLDQASLATADTSKPAAGGAPSEATQQAAPTGGEFYTSATIVPNSPPPIPVVTSKAATDGGKTMRPAIAEDDPPPAIDLRVGMSSYVPVNANNDNGSGWAHPGIPITRDFSTNNYAGPNGAGDPELVPLGISWTVSHSGTITLSCSNFSTAAIKFWKNANKTAEAGAFSTRDPDVVHGKASAVVYVEGVHESITLLDIRITVLYTPDEPDLAPVTVQRSATVTPLINSFTATPTAMTFMDSLRPVGTHGLLAGSAPAPGISLRADVINGPLTMKFSQNVTDDIPHFNGSPAGYVYTAAGIAAGLHNLNYVPDPAKTFSDGAVLQFPLLDAGAGGITDYNGFNSVPNPTGDSVVITANDSPASFARNNNDKLEKIDDFFKARAYLVVSYGDGSIYTVAYINWSANFYATTNAGPGGVGVTVIQTSSVVIPNDYVRSNENPETRTPTYNDGMTWVNA